MTQAAGRVHWIEGRLSIASFSSSIGVPAAIWVGYKLQAGPGRAGSGGAANFTVTGPQLERGEALCGLIPANGGEESWAFSPPLSAGRQRCCATVSKGGGRGVCLGPPRHSHHHDRDQGSTQHIREPS